MSATAHSTPSCSSVHTHAATDPLKYQQEKQAFAQFVEDFLQVRFSGIQPGFESIPDQILFASPSGSTLAVPFDVLLLDREFARTIIQNKIKASQAAFAKGASA
jgi:hypothetical protein